MKKPLIDPAALSLIDGTIDDFFAQSIQDAEKIDPSYARLWKYLHTLIQSGGKRLRPQMTLMSYAAFGGKDIASIAPIAAAQELLHFALLIHDDIIDRDYVRYGTANIAGEYKQAYAPHAASEEDLTHYAHSAAILGGDLMLSSAHRLIAAASTLPSHLVAAAQHLLSIGIFEVAGGELLDTEFSFVPYRDGGALKVATYKTASYSFIAPLLTGAALASATESHLASLREYAINLGVAYQLADDLLGVFGDEAMTGKSTQSDIVEGKRTYLVEVAFSLFSPTEQATFTKAFGNPAATKAQIDSAKLLLETSGAKQKTEQTANSYVDKALTALSALDLPDEHHARFFQLANKVVSRTS